MDVPGEARLSSARTSTTLVLFACFVAALLEGVDLQSIGVAAPRMAREFGLTVAQMGFAFSAGTLGLLPGALLGGRLADRLGRKRVLLASIATYGIFSFATAHVWNYETLLVARFLTGAGLGGAMPNLITLSAESVPLRIRNTAVSIMYCGMPLGSALAALIGIWSAGAVEWRNVFYVGGIGPLAILPLLAICVPTKNLSLTASNARDVAADSTRSSARQILFGSGRVTLTLQIWISFFCTLIVLYFLLNWLPSLIIRRGLSSNQAGLLQFLFNAGAFFGVLLIGTLMDRIRPVRVVAGVYLAIVASLIGLSVAASMGALAASVIMAGAGVGGAQGMLYAMAAACYPPSVRGTGVGAAVAAGRLGSVAGPAAAGLLLAIGTSGPVVIGASLPVTFIAAFAAIGISRSRSITPGDGRTERSALEPVGVE